MSGKSLPRHVECGKLKEADRGDVGASSPALDIDDLAKGDRAMPRYGKYTPPQTATQAPEWFPIWELASRLVRKAGAE